MTTQLERLSSIVHYNFMLLGFPPVPPLNASVIIPARNSVSTIGEQLEALAAQEYLLDFEVLVCDNGSTDGLRDFVDAYPKHARMSVTWLDASEEPGAAFARNVGIKASKGDFLAFCDADDRVHPGWLQQLILAADTADLVSGAMETESINDPLIHSWRPLEPTAEPLEYSTFLPRMMSCNFGAWKHACEAVGGFDEIMSGAGEDVDFSWRIQLAGMTFTHEPKAVVAYRLRSTLRDTWRQSKAYGESDVDLYVAYREYGFKRSSANEVATQVIGVVLLNPLVPRRLAKIPRGRWVIAAGALAGKLHGSWKRRVWYI